MRLERVTAGLLLMLAASSAAAQDPRQAVELPPMMQQHLLANMRDHLQTLDGILAGLADGRLDEVAELAEQHLGMSSLPRHGAAHMAPYMPEGMRETGQRMHHAASRFARIAQEGDRLRAYAALRDVTSSCVACHAAFRIR